MTDGKIYMLKLKSSARKSVWCGCSCERVLLALYLVQFQTYDKTVSSGEDLLQLCSVSDLDWMQCALRYALLWLTVDVGGSGGRTVVLPS